MLHEVFLKVFLLFENDPPFVKLTFKVVFLFSQNRLFRFKMNRLSVLKPILFLNHFNQNTHYIKSTLFLFQTNFYNLLKTTVVTRSSYYCKRNSKEKLIATGSSWYALSSSPPAFLYLAHICNMQYKKRLEKSRSFWKSMFHSKVFVLEKITEQDPPQIIVSMAEKNRIKVKEIFSNIFLLFVVCHNVYRLERDACNFLVRN